MDQDNGKTVKRAAVDHPKIQRLQRRLSLTRFEAMGLLEALWHFTGRYAPQGDLGRWSDEEIAAWIEWPGDPGELIGTLVICGWLDVNETYRLVVHDWPDHADEATKVSLKRAGKTFVVATNSGTVPTKPQPVATVSGPPEPEPEPEPCHAMPEPPLRGGTNMAAETASSAGRSEPIAPAPRFRAEDWEAFIAVYPPRNGDRGLAKGREKFMALIKSGVPPGDLLEGAQRYRAWADAEGSTGSQFVQQIPTWLNRKGWQEEWAIRTGGNGNGPHPAGQRGNRAASESLEAERDRILGNLAKRNAAAGSDHGRLAGDG